jgi:hypothetical protein
MTQDFIFAQDVILDPDTGKSVAVVRNGEVFRDGMRIAVLVGAYMYDLNGNLLGKLAGGARSLPISFKNLIEASGGQTSARKPAEPELRFLHHDVPRHPEAPRRRADAGLTSAPSLGPMRRDITAIEGGDNLPAN